MQVKIADIQKVNHQETNTDFLDVTFEIVEGKKVLSSHKEAFPVDSSKKVISDYAKTYLAGYVRDEEQKEANAENDKLNQHVGNLQEELVGSAIDIEDVAKPKKK